MIKVRVKVGKLKEILLNKKRLQAASEKLAQLIKSHIVYGVDSEGKPFTPLDYERMDGSTENPLLATGKHLLKSVHGYTIPNGFGVGTSFIGARILNYGTTGKGGTLPSITPKKGGSLKVPFYLGKSGKRNDWGYIYVNKVDIHPRPFFSISDSEIREVLRAFNNANK